ncbi:cation:proton antiporter [Synechococcus sp. PCC 6312]|uniref:cation:proton antiporter domain-containing protein n=1 Tax=Synechococcus sp. (strain ATCC 27167 / PCC 6312) TaxID=195253 RepID=UPI00029F2236|nr:cation:proton antiporter [Synechococcus sp. PCC 6312]AFY59312.1 Kef-type K+ transport system, membrane component [Synechococcus sp. PCC 6312]
MLGFSVPWLYSGLGQLVLGGLVLLDNPVFIFTILIAVSLSIPPIFERIKLPGLVGLLLAGIILGPSGLQFLNHKTETMVLLSGVGKIYLMFVAGLEIDLSQFRKTRNRSMGFGFLTFIVPLMTGMVVGRWFGFGWNGALLIGSLFASHTLLAYPIVSRLGVVQNEAITVTIGATIFTDTAALLVLAICVGIAAGNFTAWSLMLLLVALAVYSVAVLWGIDRVGKEFFRRSGDNEGNQFLFVLLALFVASVGAQVIGIEQIVGAFLAGLAVNDVIGESPVKEKVEFVGGVLFIPFFFIDMGLLIDLPAFLKTLSSWGLTLAIVGGLIGSKFVAAWLASVIYRYSRVEMLSMWSLSLPQVAATLAATLVGYQQGILTQDILNSVIVLMVVTSILGPLITSRVASRIPVPQPETDTVDELWRDTAGLEGETDDSAPFTVIVPVQNPQTERSLIQLAALLARHEQGRVVPLVVTRAAVHMDDPGLETSLQRGQKLLRRAVEIGQAYAVPLEPQLRIDDDVPLGITRLSREENSNLIIVGWSEKTGLRARLFGTVIDSILWSAHCPVAITRLLDEPENIQSILVPVRDLTAPTLRIVGFAQALAAASQADVTLLHVCLPGIPSEQMTQFEAELARILPPDSRPVCIDIQTVAESDIASAILGQAASRDLVLMRSIRRRTTGGLAVSDITTQVVKELPCSVILFGEPHS